MRKWAWNEQPRLDHRNITGRVRLVFSFGGKNGGKKSGDFGAGVLEPAQSHDTSGKIGVVDLS